MKILLVHPDNKRNILVGSYSIDPLGLEYIATVLTQMEHNVKIISQIDLTDSVFLNEILDFNPDFVGFSVYSFNFNSALELAKLTKKFSKNIMVVFGGYHPTACPEIVEHTSIDFVICGEGEYAFIDLISFVKGEVAFDSISGIFYWDSGLKGRRQQDRVNFCSLPSPTRRFELLKNNKVRQIIYPSISKQKCVAQINYSRGCPYNCSFCNSQLMFPGSTLWRDPSEVIDELQELVRNYGTNLVFFSDLTFNASKRKVHLLCDEIIKSGVHLNWCAMCRIDNIDNDLLLHIREAGCVKVSYGIENFMMSIYTKKRYEELKKEKLLKVISKTSEVGLLVRGLFILGFPDENHKSLNELNDFILSSALDDLRISFCTPFPGTSLYEQCKQNDILLTGDFSDFTTSKPVVKLNDGLHARLEDIRRDLVQSFYAGANYKNHISVKIQKYPFLCESYAEYFQLLKAHDLISDKIFKTLLPISKKVENHLNPEELCGNVA